MVAIDRFLEFLPVHLRAATSAGSSVSSSLSQASSIAIKACCFSVSFSGRLWSIKRKTYSSAGWPLRSASPRKRDSTSGGKSSMSVIRYLLGVIQANCTIPIGCDSGCSFRRKARSSFVQVRQVFAEDRKGFMVACVCPAEFLGDVQGHL